MAVRIYTGTFPERASRRCPSELLHVLLYVHATCHTLCSLPCTQLQDTCRERDATALGLVRGGGGQQQHGANTHGANTHGGEYGRNVVLGVPPGGSSATVVLQPGDKVVVLAEDGHL